MPNHERIIAVYDLDGTLIDTDDKIKIKYPNTDHWKRVSGAEFAVIRNNLPHGCQLNFDEFIGIPLTARPIVKNLKLMDEHLKNNHDIGILTARMDVAKIWDGLANFLRYKNENGELLEMPVSLFKKANIFSADTSELRRILDVNYSIAHAKAYVIYEVLLAKFGYDRVYFYDDDAANIEAVRYLNDKRISVVKVDK